MDSLKRKAVGFYWTLPVPWVGFRDVPANIDEAASKSRTIRYQRDLTRRYAKDNGFELIHEAVFVELRPDGGTKEIAGPLAKVAELCRAHDAVMLYTDFAEVKQWRTNEPMMKAAAKLGIAMEPVPVARIFFDGEEFDPYDHFSQWRHDQHAWTEGKPARLTAARQRALALRAEGAKNPEIAGRLNEEGLRSATGTPWTADSLRKALAAES